MSVSESSSTPVVQTRLLSKRFKVRGAWFGRKAQYLHAVNQVNLEVYPQETLGLVGESGCGKSTLGRLVLRLLEPSEGTLSFEGQDITRHRVSQMRPLRKKMQIVFQDPYSALNPRMSVGAAIGEAMRVHKLAQSKKEERDKVVALLERVGLRKEYYKRYPHEFSGGQRQRIGIARALAVEPDFIVCDEPVSALDVSVQAQVVNLLKDLQEELGLSYLFIAHDLKVVEFMSDRVAVMYLGQIVELARAEDLYKETLHPYTKALLAAVPIPDPGGKRKRIVLEGDVPSPIYPPVGCHFHPRCPIAQKGLCDVKAPELRELRPGHKVSCHLAE